jgi:hypothetical protein
MFLFRRLIFLPSTCLTWNFVKGQKIKQERGEGNMGGGLNRVETERYPNFIKSKNVLNYHIPRKKEIKLTKFLGFSI